MNDLSEHRAAVGAICKCGDCICCREFVYLRTGKMKPIICYWVTLSIKEPGKPAYQEEAHLSPGECQYNDQGEAVGDEHFKDNNIYFYLEGKRPHIGMDIGNGIVQEVIVELTPIYEGF